MSTDLSFSCAIQDFSSFENRRRQNKNKKKNPSSRGLMDLCHRLEFFSDSLDSIDWWSSLNGLKHFSIEKDGWIDDRTDAKSTWNSRIERTEEFQSLARVLVCVRVESVRFIDLDVTEQIVSLFDGENISAKTLPLYKVLTCFSKDVGSNNKAPVRVYARNDIERWLYI